MRTKYLISAVLCLVALTGCSSLNLDFPIFGKREAVVEAGPSGGKPLGNIERQRLDCETRLGKIEGTAVEAGDCITIVFRCDTLFDKESVRIIPATLGLTELAAILQEYPDTMVKVDVHTDCMHSEEQNFVQSEARAWAVKGALVEKGVDASRITARGWGESKPVASNATEAGRRENRRVIVTLMTH